MSQCFRQVLGASQKIDAADVCGGMSSRPLCEWIGRLCLSVGCDANGTRHETSLSLPRLPQRRPPLPAPNMLLSESDEFGISRGWTVDRCVAVRYWIVLIRNSLRPETRWIWSRLSNTPTPQSSRKVEKQCLLYAYHQMGGDSSDCGGCKKNWLILSSAGWLFQHKGTAQL